MKEVHIYIIFFIFSALGDSNYTSFCNCGKMIEKQLRVLGAEPLCPPGWADDAVGYVLSAFGVYCFEYFLRLDEIKSSMLCVFNSIVSPLGLLGRKQKYSLFFVISGLHGAQKCHFSNTFRSDSNGCCTVGNAKIPKLLLC